MVIQGNLEFMKKFLTAILFAIPSLTLFGTAQTPDILIFNGDTLSLYTCPLNSYPDQNLINPKELFGSTGCFHTACWRNYVATWEFIDDQLYLTEIRNACYPTKMRNVSVSYKSGVKNDQIGREYADLKELFPERFHNGRVKADWVTGKLYSPQGRLLFYIHDGFQSIYQTELEFTVNRGVLMKCKTMDNSKTKESKYLADPTLLRDYIYNNIKRENLPNSDTIRRRVYINIISSDETGKIDRVKVVRGVNEVYDNEAIRIIKSIAEWEVLYRHGEKINRSYTVPVVFDLTDK